MSADAAAPVTPIDEPKSQYLHVTTHLYAASERWDLVVLGLPNCRVEALAEGCAEAHLEPNNHNRFERACDSCKAQIYVHHDRHMAPAYVEAARTFVESAPLRKGCTGYVGRNGVLVIVGPRRIVTTAYRNPPSGGRRNSNEDYVKEMIHVLRRKAARAQETNMNPRQHRAAFLATELRPLLAKFADGTHDPNDAYWLLVLVAQAAQVAADSAELQALLYQAERAQVATTLQKQVKQPEPATLLASLRQELSSTVDPQGTLEDALFELDDWLALCELRGDSSSAQQVAMRAVAMLAQYPDRVRDLGTLAIAQLDVLPAQAFARGLWQTVAQADAASGALSLIGGVVQRIISLLEWATVLQALRPKSAAPRVKGEPFEGSWFDCYQVGTELIVQVQLPAGQRLRGAPQLTLLSAEGTRSLPVQVNLQKPGSVWLSLGTEEQLAKSLGQVREALGVTVEQLESVHIQLELEPEANAERDG